MNILTWDKFKELVEAAGVKGDSTISWIDIGTHYDEEVTVTLHEDNSFTVVD